MPSVKGAMQVRTLGMPFTDSKQEEHFPIPQKNPRGWSYRRLRVNVVMPAAWRAEPIVSP